MEDEHHSWAEWADTRAYSEGFMVSAGVTLAVMASLLVCLGLSLQKVSLCMPGNEDVSPWNQPKWTLGFILMVMGNLLDFVAFGLAPQSLLAPLAALSLVWNLFMSSSLLGEDYDSNDVAACALIFVGTGITVVFSNHHEHEYKLETLRELYQKPRMAVYAVLTPLLLRFHYWLVQRAEQTKHRAGGMDRLAELVGWCGFAGITGGNSVLFAKSTIELIKDAFHGDDVFWHLDTYLIVAAMLVCLLTQISFLNGAMKRFEQLYVLPIYQSYWIISGVVGGLVYFGEFEELSARQIQMFMVGTVVTLAGLYVLTKKKSHSLDGPGAAAGFDVLPTRRISEDSLIGGGGGSGSFDSEDGLELSTRNLYAEKPRGSDGDVGLYEDARRRSSSRGMNADL